MIQTAQPNVKLNGIEYLLLSIQSNPGKSQRWHLRRKHMYLHGRPDFHKGGTGSGYFNSPSYRNILWRDRAPMNVTFQLTIQSTGSSKKPAHIKVFAPNALKCTLPGQVGFEQMKLGKSSASNLYRWDALTIKLVQSKNIHDIIKT